MVKLEQQQLIHQAPGTLHVRLSRAPSDTKAVVLKYLLGRKGKERKKREERRKERKRNRNPI